MVKSAIRRLLVAPLHVRSVGELNQEQSLVRYKNWLDIRTDVMFFPYSLINPPLVLFVPHLASSRVFPSDCVLKFCFSRVYSRQAITAH